MLSFRTWIEEATHPLSIALVGWTGSSTDRQLFEWVHNFLCTGPHVDWDIVEAWPHARTDIVNLNQGRDFLKESHPYDIVILCWLYTPQTYAGYDGEFNVSDKHTPQEWRSRLASTGAKYIFASGAKTEVGGDFLGPLQNYRMVQSSPSMTVYINWGLYR